jgi:ABC-type antimicrobial peptide transport system permease subunit
LFIALMGILAGFLLLALFVTGTRDSSLPVYLPVWVPPAHVLFTIVLCFMGSLLAMRKATSVEPASAFR